MCVLKLQENKEMNNAKFRTVVTSRKKGRQCDQLMHTGGFNCICSALIRKLNSDTFILFCLIM